MGTDRTSHMLWYWSVVDYVLSQSPAPTSLFYLVGAECENRSVDRKIHMFSVGMKCD